MTNNEVCSAKTRKKVFWRWLLHGETGWNYEKMQGSGYCYSVMPMLKEVYKDDPDGMQAAVKNHLQFFNTTPQSANIILGVNCAMEPTLKTDGLDVVASVKTGLMGPLAGVGDSIFGVIIGTIFGAISANLALQGSPIGIIIQILFNTLVILPIRYFLFELGYKEGINVVSSLSGSMNKLIDAANVLGLTVVGALIPTVVNMNCPAVFKLSEVEMAVQADMLDAVMPKLLPVLYIVFMYWLLGRKKMTSTKGILITLVLAIALSYFGILG